MCGSSPLPELPEVEATAAKLDRWTRGRSLLRVELLDASLLKAGDLQAVAGLTVSRAWRRAKYALLELGPMTLVFHLRMTGKLVRADGKRPPRARLHLDDGSFVGFEDVRRFAELWVLDTDDLEAFFTGKKLGPEPWPMARDGAWWAAQLGGLKSPVKTALLRQDKVAGLGNIAASEILWRAGVSPSTAASAVTPTQWAAIAEAAPAHLAMALADASQEDFVYLTESKSAANNPFRVYGREEEPCPRCGVAVARFVQSGRATFWCPGCQQ